MPQLDDSGKSNSTQIDKGVYVSLVTIVRIEDQSVHPRWKDDRPKQAKSGKDIELKLQVTYDTGEWERRMWFTGYYKKDKVIGIKGWNAKRNSVQDFLTELTSKETVQMGLNEDYSIKPEFLNQLIGKKFYRISYVSGTWTNPKTNVDQPNYNDFKQIFKEGVDTETIKEAWIQALQWLKDYKPDVLEIAGDTSFGYGANAPETTKEDDVI